MSSMACSLGEGQRIIFPSPKIPHTVVHTLTKKQSFVPRDGTTDFCFERRVGDLQPSDTLKRVKIYGGRAPQRGHRANRYTETDTTPGPIFNNTHSGDRKEIKRGFTSWQVAAGPGPLPTSPRSSSLKAARLPRPRPYSSATVASVWIGWCPATLDGETFPTPSSARTRQVRNNLQARGDQKNTRSVRMESGPWKEHPRGGCF